MGSKENSPPLTLKAGRRYPIKLEYFDRHGHARMHLRWSSSAMPETVIQQRWLHPAHADEAAIPRKTA